MKIEIKKTPVVPSFEPFVVEITVSSREEQLTLGEALTHFGRHHRRALPIGDALHAIGRAIKETQ
jgi:hypothetical protein